MRSNKQKEADARYREKTKGKYKTFTTAYKVEELERIEVTLKNYNVSKADLVRRAAERLNQGDDLTGRYDAASGRVIPVTHSEEE